MVRYKKVRPRVAAQPIAEFELQGGKIVRGSFIGSYLPSLWFWNNPPEPDERFAPTYRRAISGDLQALVEFYRRHGTQPGDAFYKCIGYLAAAGGPQELKVVRKIMSINRRGGPPASGFAKRQLARDWEKRLLVPAQWADKWIWQQRQAEQKQGNVRLSRTELWKKYLSESLDRTVPADLYGQILNEFGLPKPPPQEQIRILKLTEKELRARDRGILQYVTAIYLAHGIVPKSLFFTLAQSCPSHLPPSVAVRRFAWKLTV